MIDLLYKFLISWLIGLLVVSTAIELIPQKCEKEVEVAQISNCNFLGDCAIVDTKGEYHTARYPIKGQFASVGCGPDFERIFK